LAGKIPYARQQQSLAVNYRSSREMGNAKGASGTFAGLGPVTGVDGGVVDAWIGEVMGRGSGG